MEPVKLTNTETLALAHILDEERRAEERISLMQKALSTDIMARLGIKAGALKIDVASGTVEVIEAPRDAVSD